jgi:hypothetical protein
MRQPRGGQIANPYLPLPRQATSLWSLLLLVMYRTSNGLQKSKHGFKGFRQAQAFLKQTMAAVDRGLVVSAKESFVEYIDQWLDGHRPRLEGGTEREYEAPK